MINLWHIINGKWVHICQVHHHNKTVYYVDGVISGEIAYE